MSLTQDSFTLYNTLNLCKQATDEWKLSVSNRIGFPTSNTDNFPIGHGQSAFGYSEALYNFAEVLTGDKIREIQNIYRILYQKSYNNTQAVEIIEAEMEVSSERDEIIQFIRDSQRGIMKGYSKTS